MPWLQSDCAEGAQGDSTSRDKFINPAPDIYVTNRQTSIVTFLSNKKKEQRGSEEVPQAPEKSSKPRSRQLVDSKKKKKENDDESPLPSSDKMRKLMLKFAMVGDKERNVSDDTDRGGMETNPSITLAQEESRRVEEVRKVHEVPKSMNNFASVDIRTKMAFDTTNNVKTKINAIVEADANVKCVVGSGRCATHHVKLVRNVRKKRYSCINPVTGGLIWQFRDVTSLECPSKAKKTGLALESSDMGVTASRGQQQQHKV